jgi:hypothetical protein
MVAIPELGTKISAITKVTATVAEATNVILWFIVWEFGGSLLSSEHKYRH